MSVVSFRTEPDRPHEILGVIPARGGSKRLKGKNTRLLAGVPLIHHTIRAAQASQMLCDFLVSTDDRTIAEMSRRAGAPVPFLRPARLAGDRVSIWPAVRHAVDYWEARNDRRLEAVVLLQPTSPLRTAGDIDACVRQFRASGADLCLTAGPSRDNPYVNLVQPDPRRGLPFVRACEVAGTQHARRQDAPPVYAVNGGVYVVRRTHLNGLENYFTGVRLAVSLMPRSRSVDIDDADDFALAEFWLMRTGTNS